jgi:hypothetical protein
LRLVAETDPASDLGVAIALLVLRDAAAMSRWIIAPRGSRPEHPFMSTVEMADARRLERAALSHPAAVLATMKAGELLFRASFAETRARAMAWERRGDLPLDLAAARLDATPAPASPRP